MVKIDFTANKSIPIEIGPLKTDFKYDDNTLDSIIKSQEKLNDVAKKYQNFSDDNIPDNFSIKELKKDIQNITDVFLGKGSFKTLYDVCPSTIKITQAISKAMDMTMTEIANSISKA